MSITEKLDLAIKLQERKTTSGGYVTTYENERFFRQTYMMNAEWETFVEYMKNNEFQPYAYTEYVKGGGGELFEKGGCPPKMASFGSSSRMLYTLSCGIKGFHYEKKLQTTIGGEANLDGFYEGENRYVFVEAKCHEPYNVKKTVISSKYKDLYKDINEKMAENVCVVMPESKCGRYLNVDYYIEGKKLERFDLKQMICHLLGIASDLLKGTLEKRKIDFIYLLYDPTELDIESKTKIKIDQIYRKTCDECNLINFAELFRVVLEFLNHTEFNNVMSDKEINDIISNFKFTLASQKNYLCLI